MKNSRFILLLIIGVTLFSLYTNGKHPVQPNKPLVQHVSAPAIAWPPDSAGTVELASNKVTKNYYIVLDGSGSMADSDCSGSVSKSEASKVALDKFFSLIPSNSNVGLSTFDAAGIREVLPLGSHTKKDFMQRVNASHPGGETPLNSAIKKAVQSLEVQGQKQLGYGEYSLVIVTDGEASRNEDPKPIVEYILDNTPIKLQTIGFCIGQNHSLNQPGRTSYQTAQSADQLIKELGNVLAEAEHFDQSSFSKVP